MKTGNECIGNVMNYKKGQKEIPIFTSLRDNKFKIISRLSDYDHIRYKWECKGKYQN